MIDEALDNAQEEILRSSADLTDAMGGKTRLYPLSAPGDAPFPHIIHGENQILDWSDRCSEGYEIYATFRIWTQDNDQGRKATLAQAERIGAVVRRLMNDAIAIVGFRVVDHRLETNRYMPDGDGLSALGLVEVRYWVEAST